MFAAPYWAQKPRYSLEDRLKILKRVDTVWIKGVLKQSLWHDAWLTLKHKTASAAIKQPYNIQISEPLEKQSTYNTNIADLYSEHQNGLLILGEAGSGKTCLLLELLDHLLKQANQNQQDRIPVLLKLVSWNNEQPFKDWLTFELDRTYDISPQLGKLLIEDKALLLLLDGLDEVAPEHRESCVKAINDYRREQAVAAAEPIIVSCQTAIYNELTKLNLEHAISIQTLSQDDIDKQIRTGGRELSGLRTALRGDSKLYDLLKTPLMLGVSMQVFEDIQPIELHKSTNIEDRRHLIFTTFLERQFKPPPKGKGEDQQHKSDQIKEFLYWLAYQVKRQKLSTFKIEELQPSFLGSVWLKILHVGISLVLSLVIMFSLSVLLSLLIGLISLPFGVITIGRVQGVTAWLAIGCIAGAFSFLSFTLIGVQHVQLSGEIDHFERLKWSWNGVFAALIIFMLVAIYDLLRGNLGILTIISAIIPSMLFMLVFGQVREKISEQQEPNRSTWLSLRHGIRMAVISATGLTVIMCLPLFFLSDDPLVSIGISMITVGCGVGVGFAYGGHAFTKHFVLRIMLARSTPCIFHILPLLDACVQRRLLQPIGSGWGFSHNLMADYFAEQYNNQQTSHT
jgi:hypothetical protein